jgi:hypothetical protein
LPRLVDPRAPLVPRALVLVVLVIESRVQTNPRLTPVLLGVTDRRYLILGRLSHCSEGIWATAGSATGFLHGVSCMLTRLPMQDVVVTRVSHHNI